MTPQIPETVGGGVDELDIASAISIVEDLQKLIVDGAGIDLQYGAGTAEGLIKIASLSASQKTQMAAYWKQILGIPDGYMEGLMGAKK